MNDSDVLCIFAFVILPLIIFWIMGMIILLININCEKEEIDNDIAKKIAEDKQKHKRDD